MRTACDGNGKIFQGVVDGVEFVESGQEADGVGNFLYFVG